MPWSPAATLTSFDDTVRVMAEPTQREPPRDPYWWTPWAVLLGLILYGTLGYLGVLSPKRGGPTAADVPTPPPPVAAARAVPSAPAPSAH
jgi:hypothetical protein